ncbi:protein polybromo-1-like [Zerene cesonia]|uniref:protein polybromo-1-like n=1 Tax=Zerene cesonia TaxID=33412 RepID=UPI0018E58F4A|nr:protein polybromo-1-like [Zerene cesonia]
MSKRRRASSVASRGADGDDSDDVELSNPGPPPSRKKKKLEPSEICQQLYDTIRSFKKEDGTLLCDSFIRAPKRRQEPQYYEVVSHPIDLLRVQQKLKTDTYEDIDELSADIELLVNNAKAFYKPDSEEYKDAIELWKLYTKSRQALENGDEIKTPKLSRNGSSSRRSDVAEDISETSTNNDEDNVLEELFNAVMSANADGRPLYGAFQFLPSKRRYPDYFEVIDSPIDLKTIAQKIQASEYSNLNELEKDLLLMVRNACNFNEPGSQIYKDAKMLKKIIQLRKQEIDQHGRSGPSKTSERIRSKRSSRVVPILSSRTMAILEPPGSDGEAVVKHSEDSESDEEKNDNEDSPQWKLLESVKNHVGPNGTPLADPFWKLPSRREYPDYYKEIKNPVSLNQIKNKIRRGNYGTLSEVAGDMNIMFENAKQYNVPSSRLYKDAVKLQRIMQQRVQELLDIVQSSSSDDESLSSVKNQVNTPRPREPGTVKGLGLELLDSLGDGLEMNFEYFCEYIHAIENTLILDFRSSTDESLPAGGAPPQTQYCKGEFVYVQAERGAREPSIVQIARLFTNADHMPMAYVNVYYRPHETFHVRTRKFLHQEVFKTEAHRSIPLDQVIGRCYVMNVKEYFKFRPEGYADKDVYVCESRYNSKNRWFKKIKVWEGAEKEVTLVPREVNKTNITKKVPLEPNRTVSVFRERVEKHKDELAELEVLENVQEKERPDVVMYNPLGTDDENTYYEQYNTVCSGVIKTGDYVYVVTDGGKQLIAQVDTIWETGDNKCYFRGPFLIFPSEVANIINKPFYKQEVLLTTMHDTSPLVGIVGKCAVLDYDDYLKCRPTEISENDVFVCESLYDESNRVARKLKSGLRKFEHTKDVTVDEVYYFPKPLGPPLLASAQEVGSAAFTHKAFTHNMNSDCMDVKPQFTNLINTTIGSQDVEMLLENSLDDSSLASPATPLSIGGNSNPYNPSLIQTPSQEKNTNQTATPATGKKKKEQKQKIVTGYILYSSEVRKAIVANNPECTFGEISRIVGNEWRSLPASTKQCWEERAARCNEETAARLADEMKEIAQHNNLVAPTCASAAGHVQQHYRGGGATGASEYPCLWRSCTRVRKGQAPFPNLPRLLRHVRDLHVNKGNGRLIAVHERSRNFMPSSKKPSKSYTTTLRTGVLSPGASLSGMSPMARSTPSPGCGEGAGSAGGAGAAGGAGVGAVGGAGGRPPLEPLFVSAPPRVQRVTHSDAYIRYIEGLHSEQKYITPWEKSLTPMPANPDPAHFNMHKLPAHWMTEEAINGYLAQDKNLTESDIQKMDQNTKILRGLCALRDFMMKDAFAIYKSF